MILGSEIIKQWKYGRIVISPFNEDNVGPNSYDVTLSPKLLQYRGDMLDMKRNNFTRELTIGEDGLILLPNELYLGCTNEVAGSDYYVPMYEGRSSLARLGIQSHLSAGFGDIGFKSNWTLEITVVKPTKIYPNVRIGQVYFHDVVSSRCASGSNSKAGLIYSGKYTNQPEPQASKSYEDFRGE